MSTIVGWTCPQDKNGGGVVLKNVRPTNCNRGPFIIVSGSLNNTLYLWSTARQSGIVWEVLRSRHTQRGNTGQFRVALDPFHRPCRRSWDFPESSNCAEVILKWDYGSLLAREVNGSHPPAQKRWSERINSLLIQNESINQHQLICSVAKHCS